MNGARNSRRQSKREGEVKRMDDGGGEDGERGALCGQTPFELGVVTVGGMLLHLVRVVAEL